MREASGFEDREGHRAPWASGARSVARLSVGEAYVGGARSFRRILGHELDSLTLTQKFEDGAPDCRAVKKMFGPPIVANETEAFVDQQSSNRAAGHVQSFVDSEAHRPLENVQKLRPRPV